MSRKRTSCPRAVSHSSSAYDHAPHQPHHCNQLQHQQQEQGQQQPVCEEACVYYRPGCYCIPQVMRPPSATPYTCAYLHDYPLQWPAAGHDGGGGGAGRQAATYVVDSCGIVYYLSDMESVLQLPTGLAVATDITYHYDAAGAGENGVCDGLHVIDGDEEAVSPRKRERFECVDIDDVDSDSVEGESEDSLTKSRNGNTSNCYRSEQGYLVEEPNDAEGDVPALE